MKDTIGGCKLQERTETKYAIGIVVDVISTESKSDAYFRLGKKLEAMGKEILEDHDRARSVMAP